MNQMKMYLEKLISKLISMTLLLAMLGPIQLSVTPKAYAQISCGAGQVYDAKLGRCLSSKQASQVQAAVQGCMGKGTKAEQDQCYITYANNKLNESGLEAGSKDYVDDKFSLKNKSTKQGTIVAALGLALSLYTIASVSKNIKECQTTSLWVMLGGSVAAIASEITGFIMYKNGLKKLEEEYKTLAGNNETESLDQQKVDATTAQTQAFEYLAKKEDLFRKTANTKGAIYAVAGTAFTAAAVLAVTESIAQKTPAGAAVPATCTQVLKHQSGQENPGILSKAGSALFGFIRNNKDKKDDKDKKPEEGKNKNSNVTDGIVSSAGMDAASKGTIKGFKAMLVSPETRIVANGIFAGFAISLSVKSFKEAKKAKDRAAYLRALKYELEQTNGIVECTPEERSIPKRATCYCYNDDWTKNENRENSALCQKHNRDQETRLANSTDYNDGVNSVVGQKYGCVNRQMNYDQSCSCRKQILKDGQNNCFKTSPALTNMGSLGSANWMKELTSTTDDLLSGQTTGADVNGQGLLKKVARINKLKDKLIAKKGGKALADKIKQIEAKAIPKLTSFSPRTLANYQQSQAANGFGEAKAFGLDKITDPTLKSKLAANSPAAIKSTEGLSVTASGTNDYDFALDGGNGGVAFDQSGLDEAMEKNYDFGNNDIHVNTGASIFELVSTRYQISGLKRLFKEDKQPQK